MFAGHQMAALALGAAFLCAFWGEFKPAWCGFFCALAVALEYPSAPAAAIVAGAALLYHRRGAARLVLGALPWVLVLAQFHRSAFGAPWSTPYSHLENPEFVRGEGLLDEVAELETVLGEVLREELPRFHAARSAGLPVERYLGRALLHARPYIGPESPPEASGLPEHRID